MKTFIFDLGNVLFAADLAIAANTWHELSGCPLLTVNAEIIDHRKHHQFECGRLSEADFFRHVRSTLGLAGKDVDLLSDWNGIYGELLVENVKAMESLSAYGPLVAFTNTNETHERVWRLRYAGQLQLFSTIYSSHRIHLRKPDPAAFLHVLHDRGINPDQAVFFDDRKENVRAAEAVGMEGVLVTDSAVLADWVDNFTTAVTTTLHPRRFPGREGPA